MDQNERDEKKRASRSIDGFCLRQNISRTKYFRDRDNGRGPVETTSGRKITISPEAEAAWVLEHQSPSDPEERLLQLEAAARRRDQAQKAGRASAKSPNHYSKTRGAKVGV